MAITVRLPNGQALTYNGANFTICDEHQNTLYPSEAEASKRINTIAIIPHAVGAIIEYVPRPHKRAKNL